MQIHQAIRVVNGDYHAEVGLADGPVKDSFTPVEWDALQMVDAPTFDAGGLFDDGGGTTWTDAEDLVAIPGGLPVKKVFSPDDFGDAEARIILWVNTLITRIDAAVTTARTDAAAIEAAAAAAGGSIPTEGTTTINTGD